MNWFMTQAYPLKKKSPPFTTNYTPYISPLKNGGWKTTCPFGARPFFSRSELLVSGRVFILLMVQKSCTTWDVNNPVNSGINYQPQLVQDFWTINSMTCFAIILYMRQNKHFITFHTSLGYTARINKHIKNKSSPKRHSFQSQQPRLRSPTVLYLSDLPAMKFKMLESKLVV